MYLEYTFPKPPFKYQVELEPNQLYLKVEHYISSARYINIYSIETKPKNLLFYKIRKTRFFKKILHHPYLSIIDADGKEIE